MWEKEANDISVDIQKITKDKRTIDYKELNKGILKFLRDV